MLHSRSLIVLQAECHAICDFPLSMSLQDMSELGWSICQYCGDARCHGIMCGCSLVDYFQYLIPYIADVLCFRAALVNGKLLSLWLILRQVFLGWSLTAP
jgi:hypothetical protein